MPVELTAEEKAAEKEAAAAEKAAAKASADQAAATAKREAAERKATEANVDDIILIRGLARAVSPHGSESLADALDNIANAIVAGETLDADVWVEIAIALKNADKDWNAMVKKITELVTPEILPDRSVFGVLKAVEDGTITKAQGQDLLRLAPGADKAKVG